MRTEQPWMCATVCLYLMSHCVCLALGGLVIERRKGKAYLTVGLINVDYFEQEDWCDDKKIKA
jgi:hypothetical protein